MSEQREQYTSDGYIIESEPHVIVPTSLMREMLAAMERMASAHWVHIGKQQCADCWFVSYKLGTTIAKIREVLGDA